MQLIINSDDIKLLKVLMFTLFKFIITAIILPYIIINLSHYGLYLIFTFKIIKYCHLILSIKCKTTDSQAYFTKVNRLFINVYSKMNYFDSICRPDGIRTFIAITIPAFSSSKVHTNKS